MRVGDLVKIKSFNSMTHYVGIVLNLVFNRHRHITGVKILWSHGEISTVATPDFLEVISV